MQIKDVEKVTGLTAKSIRLYEKKGLFSVKRNRHNDYREYSEENIYQLKKIKIMRYLGFSISEIKKIFYEESCDIQAIFNKKKETLIAECDMLDQRIALIKALSKEDANDPSIIDEYSSAIDFFESDDSKDLNRFMKSFTFQPVGLVLMESLIFLGPISALCLAVYTRQWKSISIILPIALLSTTVMTLLWKNYFYYKNRYGSKKKGAHKKLLFILPVLAANFLVLFAGSEKLSCILTAPKKWIFLCLSSWTVSSIILIAEVPVITALVVLFHKLKRTNKCNDVFRRMHKMRKFVIPTIVIWLLLLCASFSNSIFVTDHHIAYYSLLHPRQIPYDCNHATKMIETINC